MIFFSRIFFIFEDKQLCQLFCFIEKKSWFLIKIENFIKQNLKLYIIIYRDIWVKYNGINKYFLNYFKVNVCLIYILFIFENKMCLYVNVDV